MRINSRNAQAMVEMAFGMFALALVLSAVFGFAAYIVKSLDMHREMRCDAGTRAMGAYGEGALFSSSTREDKVLVESLAAEYIFGTDEVPIKEAVHIPNLKGMK